MPSNLKSVSPIALLTADGELALDATSNAIVLKYSFLNHYDLFEIETCYGILPSIEALPVSGASEKIIGNSFAVLTYWFIKTGGIFKELSCPFWLVALGTIFILYSIVRLCQDLSKIFTKQMLYAVFAKYSAARDAASTVQGPTRGATVSASDLSEDIILCHDEETPPGVPYSCRKSYEIAFLCSVLSLDDGAFRAFWLISGIGMHTSDAIVYFYDRFFAKFDFGPDGDLLARLPPNMDPETSRQIDMITKPITVCRIAEHMAFQLVFDANEDISSLYSPENVSRVRGTAAKAVFYFMSFSRPHMKVALVLRALIILSDIVESCTIDPLHVQVLKSLMRDVHAEFPTDEDKEIIPPLLTILMELGRLLAKNKNKPVTANKVVFSTANKGAKTIVDWTKRFMMSTVASKHVDPPPPAA